MGHDRVHETTGCTRRRTRQMGCAVLAVSAAHRRRRRGIGTVLALITCLALGGGCSRVISGTPTPESGHPPGTVAGQPATNGPSGPKADVPDATTPVIGTDGGSADRLANNAVADLNDYWQRAFPKAFPDGKFVPATTLTSYDSRGPDAVICGRHTAGQAGAFSCPDDGGLVWDRGQFLPALNRVSGPIATATALAHEMGHAVQHQAGADTASPLVREQRADCFTGAFFRHATEDRAKHVRVSTGDGLNRAMSALTRVQDTGNPGPSDKTEEGSALDRVGAFQEGFDRGPARCGDIDAADVEQRTTRAQFREDARETDLPMSTESVDAIGASLREVFRDTGAAPPAIVTEPRPCGDQPFRGPASYCPDTDTVSMDMRHLRHIAQSPARGGQGDFAASAQIASRYAMSLQKAAGFSLGDEAAGMRTACMVGSWSGLLVDDPAGRRNPAGELRIAADDLDEGVAALLERDGLIAADLDGRQPPAGFARVEAFRAGFEQGLTPCTTTYAS